LEEDYDQINQDYDIPVSSEMNSSLNFHKSNNVSKENSHLRSSKSLKSDKSMQPQKNKEVQKKVAKTPMAKEKTNSNMISTTKTKAFSVSKSFKKAKIEEKKASFLNFEIPEARKSKIKKRKLCIKLRCCLRKERKYRGGGGVEENDNKAHIRELWRRGIRKAILMDRVFKAIAPMYSVNRPSLHSKNEYKENKPSCVTHA
jgi:hypothetical protein